MTSAFQTWLGAAMGSDIFAGGLALGLIGVTVAFGRAGAHMSELTAAMSTWLVGSAPRCARDTA